MKFIDRAFVAMVALMVVQCAGAQTTLDRKSVDDKLQVKVTQVIAIKTALEKQWIDFKTNKQCPVDRSVSGCGSNLPASLNPVCDRSLGDTKGCSCKGKSMVQKVAVKAPNPLEEPNAHASSANVACFAANDAMASAYKAASGAVDYENKLMYFGSVDGVMAYYPGVLWNRGQDSTQQLTCDPDYNPRLRSWFLSASNGPKNVVLILDSSGSMRQMNRMALLKKAAKQVIDSLTFADFMAVVDFDTEVKTYLDYKFLFRASSGFREVMKKFVDELPADGTTSYGKAFQRAFEVVDNSYRQNYHSNCQTVFVFLTDGANTGQDPASIIQARQQQMVQQKRKEMYFIVGLGDAVAADQDAGIKLKNLACSIGGILETVPDGATSSTGQRKTEIELTRALASFSRYFQASNSILKRDVVGFSELYTGRNFPIRMFTATAQIYDKSDADRWRFLGVAGVDISTCDLALDLFDKNPTIQDCPNSEQVETVISGCFCLSSFSFGGTTYTGGCVQDETWPQPW